MGGAQFRRERESLTEMPGSEARPEPHESETLRTRIAGELRSVDRFQRLARPVALIVFTLLGLLAVLQLYTWSRVEQLTAVSQRREERTAAALASMQDAIDRQRVNLDEAIQRTPSTGHGLRKADLEARETAEPAAVRERVKPGKSSQEPRPDAHKAAARSAAQHTEPPPAVQPAPQQEPAAQLGMQPAHQSTKIEFQSTASNRLDLSANRPEAAAGQGASALPGGEAGQENQQEAGEPSGLRVTQADTVIARDHNDIERLRRLGRRDYVEFTLMRSGVRQLVAPDIRLELKRVDSKKLRCALSIYAEDYEYPTDLSINEPVVFPVRAMWESVELVINKVGKDTVGGYLTARKGVLAAR